MILNRIGHELGLVAQWSERPAWGQQMVGHHHKAEALIQLLEVFDCGQIGGFDKGQSRAQMRSLFDRWDWLYRKYDDPTGQDFGRTYESIRDFFNPEPQTL